MTKFEWDDEKAEDNWFRHKIRFEKAVEVFDAPNRITELESVDTRPIQL